MEKIQWKVEGMTCTNCALTINKYLHNQGAKNVAVNAMGGDVSFELNGLKTEEQLAKGVQSLGYSVESNGHKATTTKKPFLSNHIQRFWFCFPFTAVLMLHMIPGLHIHWLMNPWVQLALTLPVFFVGMNYFARSAIKSIRNRMPNMNVLITIGASSAFIYSLIGALMGLGDEYLFLKLQPPSSHSFFLENF